MKEPCKFATHNHLLQERKMISFANSLVRRYHNQEYTNKISLQGIW